jgi:hypothetical protein
VKFAVEPRGEAMVELVRLTQVEVELRARVGQVGMDARAASTELAAAKDALIALERKAGAGGPTAQQRAAAEKRLARAEETAKAPWPERRLGAEAAVRDAHHRVQLHAVEHLAELVGEVEEAGAEAAEAVNDAGRLFVEAVARRREIEQALIEIVSLTQNMTPGTLNRPRSDAARQAIEQLLLEGGEIGPALRDRELVPVA